MVYEAIFSKERGGFESLDVTRTVMTIRKVPVQELLRAFDPPP